jgi:hypothetical protein
MLQKECLLKPVLASLCLYSKFFWRKSEGISIIKQKIKGKKKNISESTKGG